MMQEGENALVMKVYHWHPHAGLLFLMLESSCTCLKRLFSQGRKDASLLRLEDARASIAVVILCLKD